MSIGLERPFPPRVSIIVPCRNEERYIRSCVESARGQQTPFGGVEIIVVDGESDDMTRQILEEIAVEDARVRIVDNPKRIVSTGLNEGIRSARGEIIVRMDAHTEYAEDYVVRCVAALEESGADNVGGPARTRAVTITERAIAAAYHSPFGVGGALFHKIDYEGRVDTVTYGCWRKGSFDRYGLFDEELVRNQDDEHNLRIVRAGGIVWQTPAIRSWYRPRGSLNALFRQYSQYGYWKVRVIQKHRSPASWRHLVPGCFVSGLLLGPVLSAGLWLGMGGGKGLLGALWGKELANGAWAWVLLGWLVGVVSYLVALGVATCHTARRAGWDLLALLPAVFACYHLGYGWGFLRGVWDFVIRGKRAGEKFARLTR